MKLNYRKTTEGFVQQKLDAINKTSLAPATDELPSWQRDNGLLHWLEHLGK